MPNSPMYEVALSIHNAAREQYLDGDPTVVSVGLSDDLIAGHLVSVVDGDPTTLSEPVELAPNRHLEGDFAVRSVLAHGWRMRYPRFGVGDWQLKYAEAYLLDQDGQSGHEEFLVARLSPEALQQIGEKVLGHSLDSFEYSEPPLPRVVSPRREETTAYTAPRVAYDPLGEIRGAIADTVQAVGELF